MNISAYQVFAENLLDLVRSRGTIADTCRATNINRQQFNKYLSGQVLPSRENLEKISTYFSVASQILFTSGHSVRKSHDPFHDLTAYAEKDGQSADLLQGLFWLYSALPENVPIYERILIGLHNTNNTKKFTGIRRLGYAYKSSINYRPTTIAGVVLQTANRMSFLFREVNGLERWGTANFTVNDNKTEQFHTGLLCTFSTANEPVATPIIAQAIAADPKEWRKYYAGTGILQAPKLDANTRIAVAKLEALLSDKSQTRIVV